MKETIKTLPLMEQPYVRCEKYGPQSLSEAELLAVILKNGYSNCNCVDLARKVLDLDPTHKGVQGLMYLSKEQLMQLDGIGRVKALQLICVAELANRISMSKEEEELIFGNPQTIADYFIKKLRFKTQEYVYAVFLNQKCRVLLIKQISKGTVNASLISPREVFIEALKCGAVNVTMVHNHPSGNVLPSDNDISITKRMKECGNLLQIPLIDHIIVGWNSYYSFAEQSKL